MGLSLRTHLEEMANEFGVTIGDEDSGIVSKDGRQRVRSASEDLLMPPFPRYWRALWPRKPDYLHYPTKFSGVCVDDPDT